MWTLLATGLVFSSIFVIGYFCLPFYAEKSLLPGLAGSAGIPGFSCDVRRIGLTGADLGSLKIGEPGQQPAFRMESLRVDYSPLSLINRQVGRIVLSGIQVSAEYSGNRFRLIGLDFAPSVHENSQNLYPASFLSHSLLKSLKFVTPPLSFFSKTGNSGCLSRLT